MSIILLPHRKLKSSFEAFGGSFSGTLREPLEKFTGKYIYWIKNIPGSSLETGWYSRPASSEYLVKWKHYVETHDPKGFDGAGRILYGYAKATEKFSEYATKYK